jgi:N-acetylmuramoyl-L-alanine amidase
LSLLLSNSANAETVITGARIGDKDYGARIVLDLNKEGDYKVFTLANPYRVVIDINNAKWRGSLSSLTRLKGKYISSVRYGKPKPGVFRIVIDAKRPLAIKNKFIIAPSSSSPSFRLVVDLKKTGSVIVKKSKPKIKKLDPTKPASMQKKGQDLARFIEEVEAKKKNEAKKINKVKQVVKKKPRPKIKKIGKRKKKRAAKPTIVIDAGHGGIDPGAIGRSGVYEKGITFKFAVALKNKLEKTGRFKAILTRKGDYFVNLRERVAIAKEAKGDLFISLHADSHPNPKTRGLSVYTLSEQASDREAASLARKANRQEVINGVDLKDANIDVQKLLIDMVQRDTKNNSAKFAEYLVKGLGKNARLLKNTHRFAGFVVLTGADVPSVLVELGYVSNRTEEKLLRSKKYRDKMVTSMAKAMEKYFDNNRQ